MGELGIMDAIKLLDIIACGETSTVQFKQTLDNQDKVAAEMIAMSNSKGGLILFGVEDKTGKIEGLDYGNLQESENKLATIATDFIKPSIYITTEVVMIEEKHILIVQIQEGIFKPYKDRNGAIWVRQGSDKRRVTENSEILRLLQQNGGFIDEMTVNNTSESDIDTGKIEEYIRKSKKDTAEIEKISKTRLYGNLNIVKEDKLTLGGLLFFSKDPQKYRPTFCIKAVSYIGNSRGGNNYRDSVDILGTIPELFREGMLFFSRNLKHLQDGQNFNSVGKMEISQTALEELLQNALLHRDYTKNAPVLLMIFDDRLEIVSPGSLPNSLTVESIKMGQAVVRNNLIVSYASKLMEYRGFGSGIIRSLEQQPNIEFYNDIEGEQFIVKIPRKS